MLDDESPLAVIATDLPTISDHAQRMQLKKWQVSAIVARMNGTHDDAGKRVFQQGVTANTRISDSEFEAFADLSLNGRI